MNKDEFLKKYKISPDDFKNSGCDWKSLMKIETEYFNKIKDWEEVAKFCAETLRNIKNVHSVKMRVKESEHVIEKIIRIKKKTPECDISLTNYSESITDIIGIRVLHLFKEDWGTIHNAIINQWDMKEVPIAYHREGDDCSLFKDKGCQTTLHEFGYRSVHYLAEMKPNKEIAFVEIQVRTIFEEAWSEIDHLIRYPYGADNSLIEKYLKIFNRLAGSADEMGSFVKALKDDIQIREYKYKEEIQNKNTTIDNLKEKINKLEIDGAEKEKIKKELEELRKRGSPLFPGLFSSEEIANLSNNFEIGSNITYGLETPHLGLGNYLAAIPTCAYCGQMIIINDNYCSHCGKKIKKDP